LPDISKSKSESRKFLRGSILSFKSTQDAKDFHQSKRKVDSNINSCAISDIVDSCKVPMLNQNIDFGEYTVNRKYVESLNTSSIFKSLSKFEPAIVSSSLMKVSRTKKKMQDTERNKKLTEGLELLVKARKIGDAGFCYLK
jgi:hypothetical protein